MVLVVSKFSLVDVWVYHELLTLASEVVHPLAFESATVWPVHDSESISFVEFPLAFELSLLEVHDILVVLIELHASFSAPLAILKHADIMVTSNIFDLSISIESTFNKGTVQIAIVWMLFRFENVTHRVLVFTADDLII